MRWGSRPSREIESVLREEGGFDPEGPANHGVTQRTLDRVIAKGWKLPRAVRQLAKSDAILIYEAFFEPEWKDIKNPTLRLVMAHLIVMSWSLGFDLLRDNTHTGSYKAAVACSNLLTEAEARKLAFRVAYSYVTSADHRRKFANRFQRVLQEAGQ